MAITGALAFEGEPMRWTQHGVVIERGATGTTITFPTVPGDAGAGCAGADRTRSECKGPSRARAAITTACVAPARRRTAARPGLAAGRKASTINDLNVYPISPKERGVEDLCSRAHLPAWRTFRLGRRVPAHQCGHRTRLRADHRHEPGNICRGGASPHLAGAHLDQLRWDAARPGRNPDGAQGPVGRSGAGWL